MRTERILIKHSHDNYRAIKRVCRMAKAVYNQSLFYMRQSFFNGELMKWSDADKRLKLHHSTLYEQLPAAMAQAIIKKMGTDFSNFFKANKVYAKTPSKFKARPCVPGHAKDAKTALQPFQSLAIAGGSLHFPAKLAMSPLPIHCCDSQATLAKNAKVKELRLVPHGNCY